jgi:hypothetical protein
VRRHPAMVSCGGKVVAGNVGSDLVVGGREIGVSG